MPQETGFAVAERPVVAACPGLAIDVAGLVKVYGGDTRALDGITFGVAPGELFGLLGPNGAGKTTTIRILATLLRASAGTARVLGFDVAAQPQEVRKRLGLALQTVGLDAFSTGRETLELAGRLHRMSGAAIRRRADELLALMGLTSVAGKLTGTYSGGMKRRLDLASALMHQPELLILDEPTEGLDPQSRVALWEELERINREGTTMLLTTHYMEEADRLCSRLAIIDNGQIVVEATPAELKRCVGADTVVLQLDGVAGELERQRAEVRRRLDGMVEASAISAQPGGVALAVPNASAAIPALLRQLDGDGLRISGLEMRQPSLDDVFMKYTGRRIREEAADQLIVMGY
ncbi:MAG TPA: ATP-binding cassette domain-containing protein [Chloroflexota bacterium]|jgi:daunorubicin resistance ABC transporter ATP-binding subunit